MLDKDITSSSLFSTYEQTQVDIPIPSFSGFGSFLEYWVVSLLDRHPENISQNNKVISLE